MTVVLASGVAAATERFLVIWFFLGLAAYILLWPFRRLKGGEQGTGDMSTGSEPAIIGVTWFLAALATGIYMAHDAMSSVAVG